MERISLPIIIYSSRALVYSNKNYTIPFDGSTIGPGHVNLRLDLIPYILPAIMVCRFIRQNPSNQMQLGIL